MSEQLKFDFAKRKKKSLADQIRAAGSPRSFGFWIPLSTEHPADLEAVVGIIKDEINEYFLGTQVSNRNVREIESYAKIRLRNMGVAETIIDTVTIEVDPYDRTKLIFRIQMS